MTPKATGLLTKTALDALVEQVDQLTNQAIDHEQLECLIDAASSEFVIRGREFATTGLPGLYSGETRRPYDKQSITALLPTPLFVRLDAPFTYRVLRAYLLDKYGLVLEENEFTQASDSSAGIFDDTIIQPSTDISLGVIALTTTLNSGRFIAGEQFYIRTVRHRGAQFTADFIRQTRIPDLSELKTAATSAGLKTLFGGTALDCALELIHRHHGYQVNVSDLEVKPVVKDHSTTKVVISPRVDGISKFIGTGEFLYKKANLEALCPDALRVNLQFPTSFLVLQTTLAQTYGLIIEPDEFAMHSYDGDLLAFDTVVDGTLVDDAILELYVQPSSLKWLGRERLRIQFVAPYTESGQVRITSTAPLGMEGIPYLYQTVAEGGQGPYTFDVVDGVPPAPLDRSTGIFAGEILEGEYTWTTQATDANHRIALKREKIAVGTNGLDFAVYVADPTTVYFTSDGEETVYRPNFQPEDPPEDP